MEKMIFFYNAHMRVDKAWKDQESSMSQRALSGLLTVLRTIPKTAVHLSGPSSGLSVSNSTLTGFNYM